MLFRILQKDLDKHKFPDASQKEYTLAFYVHAVNFYD